MPQRSIAEIVALSVALCWVPVAAPQGPPFGSSSPRVDALGDPLPDGALLRLGTLRFKHPNSADTLALSPDGRVVVTHGRRQLIAWDAATGKQLWTGAEDPTDGIGGSCAGEHRLTFLPDGKTLLSAAGPNALSAWDVATGRRRTITLQRATPLADAQTTSVDVVADGKTLAVGTADAVYLADLDGAVRHRIPNDGAGPRDPSDRLLFHGAYCFARFSPDGKTLAIVTSGAPKTLRFCDPATGAERKRIDLSAYLVRLAFSPDGLRVAVTERDNAVRVYEVATGKRLHSWVLDLKNPYENYTSEVAFSPDGKLVAAGATDHVIYLWDTETGKEAGRLKGAGWYPWGLAFTADGKTLFSTGWDGVVRRWDVAARRQLPLPGGAVRGSEVVAASPDGGTLAYESEGGGVRLVETKTGRELRQLQTENEGASRLAFSPDSRLLAVGGRHGDQVHVILWDLATGKVRRRWDWDKGRDPNSTVEDIAFAPDSGRLAAAVFRRGEVRLLDLTGDGQRQLAHTMVYGLDFSPDGQTLATAGWDKALRLWDSATGIAKGQATIVLGQDDTRLYGVRYSPDGRLLAAAAKNAEVLVLDAKGLEVRNRIPIESSFIFNALAFSPDGLRLATGDSQGRVRVWDPLSGRKLWERGDHNGYVYTLGFGRDSRTLLSGGNGVGYLWDLRPADVPHKDLPELWNDLTGADPMAAELAFWALVERPAEAVKLFKDKVSPRPARPVDAARVRKLIADLNSTQFATREAANGELTRLGLDARALLKEGLAASTSAETTRRLTRLIERVTDSEATVQRHQRIVGVLRHIDDPAAAALLAEWAKTATGSLGDAARSALKPRGR